MLAPRQSPLITDCQRQRISSMLACMTVKLYVQMPDNAFNHFLKFSWKLENLIQTDTLYAFSVQESEKSRVI